MTYQEENINLGKIVFDDNNQERKSWACLGQPFSRSLIVFLSQLFVILLIIKKFLVNKGTEFAGEFKSYAKLKEYMFTLQ